MGGWFLILCHMGGGGTVGPTVTFCFCALDAFAPGFVAGEGFAPGFEEGEGGC